MKVNFILLITLLFLNTSFSQNLLSKYEIKREQFGTDIYYKDKNNKPLHGHCKISDNSGNYTDVMFNNGKKEGKSIDYNYEGTIIKTTNYLNGITVGEQKTYHHNGKIKTKGNHLIKVKNKF